MRSRPFLTLVMAAALVSFSACDKTLHLEDGQLPSDLIPYAQALVGTYTGQVDRKVMTLAVEIDADQKLRLKFSDDLIAGSCASQIGNLKEITYAGEASAPTITSAVFAFNPGQCAGEVLGEELRIKVTMGEGQATTLNLQLLDHYETQQRCGWDPPAGKGAAPTQNCRYETYPWYVRGKLTKS